VAGELIDVRGRRVPINGVVGYALTIRVNAFTGAGTPHTWVLGSTIARVYGPGGVVRATFTEAVDGTTLVLSLSAIATSALGAGASLWTLDVGGEIWIGGRLNLDFPGEDVPAGDANQSVFVAVAPYTVNVEIASGAGGGGGTATTVEEIVDTVAAAITAGANVTKTYNDGAGTITIAVPGLGTAAFVNVPPGGLVGADALGSAAFEDVPVGGFFDPVDLGTAAYEDLPAGGFVGVTAAQTVINKELTDPKITQVVTTVALTSSTATLAHRSSLLVFDSTAAQEYFLPTNASVAIPVGSTIKGVQKGTGLVSIRGVSGVTILGVASGKVTLGVGSEFEATKVATNEWIVNGQVQAASGSGGTPPPDVEIPGYIDFPGTAGNAITVPNEAGFRNTADKTVIWTMAVPDTTPAAVATVASLYNTTGNQRAWLIQLAPSGAIRWQWSEDGTNFAPPNGDLVDFTTATLPILGIDPGEFASFKIEFDAVNGTGGNTATLFLLDPDGVTWNQVAIDTDDANPSSVFASTAQLVLGGISAGTAANGDLNLRDFEFFDGIGVGRVSRFKLVSADIPADSGVTGQTFTTVSGHTATVLRSGTPDTLLVPDDTEPSVTPFPYPMGGIATGTVLSTPLSTDFSLIASIVPGGFVRSDFSWKTVQPTSSASFTWTTYDSRIAAANTAGLETLAMLGYSPPWANGAFADDKYPPAAGFEDEWQAFCNAFATRYIPLGVKVYELWNEANLSRFWTPGPNIADYVNRVLIPGANGLRAAATALGESITILTAGTAPASNGTITTRTVTNKALTSNVATLTTSVAHGLTVGKTVKVALSPADPVFDGVYTVASTPTTTTFSYVKTNANVTSAAVGGTAAFGSGVNIDPRWWVDGLYSHGGKNYFDAVAHHPYTWPYPPNSNSGVAPGDIAQWNTMLQTRDIRRAMLANGDAAKLVWATEVGLPSRDASPTYPTTGHQNFVSHSLMVTRIAEIFAEWFNLATDPLDDDWVGPLIWYQHRNQSVEPLGTNTEGGFGVVYNDGTNKPGSPSPRQALANAFTSYANT
jgi:hypothetical protein